MKLPCFVVVRGGLGNQMFQFALAEELRRKFNRRIFLIDCTADARVSRGWALGCFGYWPDIVIEKGGFKAFVIKCFGFIGTIIPNIVTPIVFTDKSKYITKELRRSPILSIGYWQSERYFFESRKELLSKFYFDSFGVSVDLLGYNYPTVAVHYRRGDYVTDSAASSVHLVCSPDWYQSALQYITAKIGDCRVLVFSDSPELARKDLRLSGDVVYIDQHHSDSPHKDMALMSMCDHFVISNSTFSWWASYLSCRKEKIVVAPRFWFVGVLTREHPLFNPNWVLL